MRPVRTKLLPVLVSVLFALVTAAVPAQAAGNCFLRLAHLSPDTPAVDVTVTAFGRPDWSIDLTGVGYGDVSGYQRIQTGTYTIAMRPAGADPASKPVISATLDGADGKAYTVAGLGTFADLALRVLDDEISLPPAGQARLRVVNAAPQAGALSISRDSTPLIQNAGFGQASPYSLVRSGSTVLKLAPAGRTGTDLPVDLEAGGVYSVLVLERNGVLSAVARQDAKGAQVVPSGGVAAGLGGTAPPTQLPVYLLVGAAIVGGAFMLSLRRRRTA